MSVKFSLRTRVAFTVALLGFVVSACLAGIAQHFSSAYVNRVAREMLRVESDYLRERYIATGVIPSEHSAHFYAFLSDSTRAPPAQWAALAAGGPYEIDADETQRWVFVQSIGAQRLYVVLDMGLARMREQHLTRDLIALVVLGTVLSAWLGAFWAGRAIAPVRNLAQSVNVLEPSSRGAVRLAPRFADDEVGILAQAFDNYQEKLYGYVRRERTFTADASHELRTPLAVIRGAIEVLLDSGQCSAAIVTRLKRMQRGADELRDLLDALLVLARSDEAEADQGRTLDLDELVRTLLAERRDALAEKHVLLEHAGTPQVCVAAPQKVLRVVLGNLLRSTLQFAEGGTLQVRVDAAAVSITHLAQGSRDCTAQLGATDTREPALGLGMIRRVCERWGWRLDESIVSNGENGFVLRIA